MQIMFNLNGFVVGKLHACSESQLEFVLHPHSIRTHFKSVSVKWKTEYGFVCTVYCDDDVWIVSVGCVCTFDSIYHAFVVVTVWKDVNQCHLNNSSHILLFITGNVLKARVDTMNIHFDRYGRLTLMVNHFIAITLISMIKYAMNFGTCCLSICKYDVTCCPLKFGAVILTFQLKRFS